LDLFKPNTLKGEWFPFGDGELLVRIIPNDVDAKLHKGRYGDKTRELIEKEGGDHLGMLTMHLYLLDRACYALVDSKNVWAPADMVTALPKELPTGAAQPERREDGMVRLDGFWSEEVKRQVLAEALERGHLGFYVLDCSKSLSAKVEAEKEKLGKA